MDDANILERLTNIEEKLDKFVKLLEKFQPLLDRYEQASRANGMLAQRRALLGKEARR